MYNDENCEIRHKTLEAGWLNMQETINKVQEDVTEIKVSQATTNQKLDSFIGEMVSWKDAINKEINFRLAKEESDRKESIGGMGKKLDSHIVGHNWWIGGIIAILTVAGLLFGLSQGALSKAKEIRDAFPKTTCETNK